MSLPSFTRCSSPPADERESTSDQANITIVGRCDETTQCAGGVLGLVWYFGPIRALIPERCVGQGKDSEGDLALISAKPGWDISALANLGAGGAVAQCKRRTVVSSLCVAGASRRSCRMDQQALR
jgi:hypothetical protein